MTFPGKINREHIPNRERAIIVGLYLSRFNRAGLKELGFDSFLEAFNVIGFALGTKPASIKNYRDEFDPLFPNTRKGWKNRPIRDYCLKVFKDYEGLDFADFTGLVRSFFGYDENAASSSLPRDLNGEANSPFAQRLITGLAAEHYFETIQSKLPEFQEYSIEKTTQLGCGYDYRLHHQIKGRDFLAIEVKGLREQTGSISMTPKEYDVASLLRHRFFLFVVRNFRDSPEHQIYPDPLGGNLRFAKKESVIVQVSWLANISIVTDQTLKLE